MTTNTTDRAEYAEGLTNAVLAGLAATFEARRLEVGFKQARLEVLTASLVALETAYFSLGGGVDLIMPIIKEATVRRIVGDSMPTLQLSEAAEAEMTAALAAAGY